MARGYEAQVVRLTGGHVRKAREMVEAGAAAGRYLEWRDSATAGLVLRIGARSATWYLRRRDATVRLGGIDDLDLETARTIAHDLPRIIRKGHDAAVYARSYGHAVSVGLDSEIAWGFALEESKRGGRTEDLDAAWTWSKLTEEFLKKKLPKLRKAWADQVEGYLTHPAFGEIAGMPVPNVKLKHLEGVRDAIEEARTTSAAYRAVQLTKEMMSWAWKTRATKSGLDKVDWEWWERLTVEYASKRRTHTPRLDELARTLLVAERHRTLSEREHRTSPGTLAALWGVVLTGQRIGAMSILRWDRLFDDHPDLPPGWRVANWSGQEMKGDGGDGRPHSLPLPPEALAVFERFRDEHAAQHGPSPYVFPSGKREGPITKQAIGRLLYRLQGRSFDQKERPAKPDRPGKPGPKPSTRRRRRPDLLEEAGVRAWTPHDARRSLTNLLRDKRLGGAASAILAHKDDHHAEDRDRMADVTREHYNSSQQIPLKVEGMRVWVDEVLAAFGREGRR